MVKSIAAVLICTGKPKLSWGGGPTGATHRSAPSGKPGRSASCRTTSLIGVSTSEAHRSGLKSSERPSIGKLNQAEKTIPCAAASETRRRTVELDAQPSVTGWM
jgi:hypothetical protein